MSQSAGKPNLSAVAALRRFARHHSSRPRSLAGSRDLPVASTVRPITPPYLVLLMRFLPATDLPPRGALLPHLFTLYHLCAYIFVPLSVSCPARAYPPTPSEFGLSSPSYYAQSALRKPRVCLAACTLIVAYRLKAEPRA